MTQTGRLSTHAYSHTYLISAHHQALFAVDPLPKSNSPISVIDNTSCTVVNTNITVLSASYRLHYGHHWCLSPSPRHHWHVSRPVNAQCKKRYSHIFSTYYGFKKYIMIMNQRDGRQFKYIHCNDNNSIIYNFNSFRKMLINRPM